jgi:putative oxidoreductase
VNRKRALLLAGRLIIGAVFVYAAYAKLRGPWLQFAVSINAYGILPENALEPVARTLPWAEMALGIAILSGIWLRWFALTGSLLLGFFFAMMVRSYAIGLKIDCGCFGPGEALGPKTLLRDGLLLVLALAVTVGAFIRSRPGRIDSPPPASEPETPAASAHPELTHPA